MKYYFTTLGVFVEAAAGGLEDKAKMTMWMWDQVIKAAFALLPHSCGRTAPCPRQRSSSDLRARRIFISLICQRLYLHSTLHYYRE